MIKFVNIFAMREFNQAKEVHLQKYPNTQEDVLWRMEHQERTESRRLREIQILMILLAPRQGSVDSLFCIRAAATYSLCEKDGSDASRQ